MLERLGNGDKAINEVLQKIEEGGYSAPYEGGSIHLAKADISLDESFVFTRKVGPDGSSLGAFASVRVVDGEPEFAGALSDSPGVRPNQPQERGSVSEAVGTKVKGVENPMGAQQLKEKAARRIEEAVRCLALTGAKVLVEN